MIVFNPTANRIQVRIFAPTQAGPDTPNWQKKARTRAAVMCLVVEPHQNLDLRKYGVFSLTGQVELERMLAKNKLQRIFSAEEMRASIAQKVAEKKAASHEPSPAPRYDEVFFEGVAALNAVSEPEPTPVLEESRHAVLSTEVIEDRLARGAINAAALDEQLAGTFSPPTKSLILAEEDNDDTPMVPPSSMSPPPVLATTKPGWTRSRRRYG